MNNSGDVKMLRRGRRRHLHDASPLDAQRVLVDGDGQLVLQDGAGLGADGAQVVGHVEGSGHDGPQRHLGAGLLAAEAEVTDNQLQASGFEKARAQRAMCIHWTAESSFHSFLSDTMKSFSVFGMPLKKKKKCKKCGGMIAAPLEVHMEGRKQKSSCDSDRGRVRVTLSKPLFQEEDTKL